MSKYLTQEQTENLKKFLKLRKVTKVRLAKILKLSNGGMITYYLKNYRFRSNDRSAVRDVLKKEALQHFNLIEK